MSQEARDAMINRIVELELMQKELKRREYLKDLYRFNTDVLGVEKDGVLSPFHKEMCDTVMADGNRKLMLVPRGHLKSTLLTVGYSLLRIAQDPTVRILIANATYDMAVTFLSQIKKHLQGNQVFRDLYGDLATGASKWSENMITVPIESQSAKKEATVTAYGIGGNLVSQHYDVIIMDDIVNRDLINTPEQIQKTILFYKDALDLLEPLTGRLLIIGTRWHMNDLYGWIMDESNPEEIYKNFSIMVRQAYQGNMETGEDFVSLFPQKFTKEYLQQLKREKGPYEFAAQYMNDCVPVETAKFKPDWFKIVGEDELRVRDIINFTTVDPAIGTKKENDPSAIVTIGVDQYNNWFLRNIIRGKFLPSELIKLIFENWEVYHPRKIGVEMTAFQKSLQYALHDEMRRRGIFLPIVELKASRSKEERIEGLIPRYANGSIFHLQTCPFRSILEEELVWYPRGKHDDVADALAYQLQIAFSPRSRTTTFSSKRKNEEGWDDDVKKRRYLY